MGDGCAFQQGYRKHTHLPSVNLLVGSGVDGTRISVEGKGMKEPPNDNETEEERSLNRRVELTILYEN